MFSCQARERGSIPYPYAQKPITEGDVVILGVESITKVGQQVVTVVNLPPVSSKMTSVEPVLAAAFSSPGQGEQCPTIQRFSHFSFFSPIVNLARQQQRENLNRPPLPVRRLVTSIAQTESLIRTVIASLELKK